jgi:hypothetical protein
MLDMASKNLISTTEQEHEMMKSYKVIRESLRHQYDGEIKRR